MTRIRNVPCPLGRELGEHLARMTDAELIDDPTLERPCYTCAFRGGTEPNGCLATVADATKAALEGFLFVCHEDGRACRGWVAARKAMGGKKLDEAPWPFVGGVD